ncbi:MAG: Crp/Fnr family transcriptional regulator [Epsilonproteobacteria bacterium]|nr:Crp/Fnr family transcriptional regulator [Campylobacterota bacterium]
MRTETRNITNENEIFLYYIQPSSMISEISTLEDEILMSYSNVVFVEESTVLQIEYKLFLEYFIQTGILSNKMMQEILKRSEKLETLINREFIFDAVTKVKMMIDSDLEMFNKLKRHDIALMLHIQPATLSRVLKKLKKDGIIDIVHGHVIKETL